MTKDSIARFLSLKCIRLRRIIGRYYYPRVDISPYLDSFRGKKGIEIGGPSGVFLDLLPIYSVIDAIDNVNYSNNTIWKNQSTEQMAENYGHKYICDATDLSIIPDASYDFLLSSHCLEHIANPLKAMGEWLRILKHGSYLLIIVPDKRYTFDHLRPITSFNHLLHDYEQNMGEDDLTHLPETIRLHDAKLDMLSKVCDVDWSSNIETRRMHHHVFDERLLKQVADYCELETMRMDWINPYHIVMLARKLGSRQDHSVVK
jgi:SAM-dependent methyltransferase